jgi:hypothetical protein
MGAAVITFEQMIQELKDCAQSFPDNRVGKNIQYSMQDALLGAFSVFFTQCPSFLAHQKMLEKTQGKSNAQTLFDIEKIPTDNHIRTLLDPVDPKLVFPVFERCFKALNDSGRLEAFRIFNGNLLIAVDGTEYHSSKKVHCDNCSRKEHANGSTTYTHSVLTPVIVSPNHKQAIPLEPEYILPQDGAEKQDCENAAYKRWLEKHSEKYRGVGATITGDDLYSRQPVCLLTKEKGLNFIFVCKPDSHKSLYEWIGDLIDGETLHTYRITRWNGRNREIYTYRYANEVPLRDSEDALFVNWHEVSVTKENGELIYKNAFVTNEKITHKNVEALTSCGRGRWKVENENNNTLKTKGYNLEHNYGHGEKNLSCLLTTLIILSFLFHTALEFMNRKYRLIRKELPSRKSFFEDIRALMRYIVFWSWDNLLNLMMEGLEIELEIEEFEGLHCKPG